jgi:hypothetical protein
MKAILSAMVAILAGLWAAGVVRAEESKPHCEVPAYLTTSDSLLGKVADAVKTHQKLDVLVIGSGSSTLPGPDGAASAYPAQLEAALRSKLTGVTVNVATELRAKQTAEQTVEDLEKVAAQRKPTLVIWQTGTVDAMRSVEPDDFRAAVDEGVGGLKAEGADVILMNPQYSPRTETMISVTSYLDNMRVIAQQHDVPLFDRFAIMRQWNEAGTFDLFGSAHGLGLAKGVHNCLGRALSDLIIDAAKINLNELRVTR